MSKIFSIYKLLAFQLFTTLQLVAYSQEFHCLYDSLEYPEWYLKVCRESKFKITNVTGYELEFSYFTGMNIKLNSYLSDENVSITSIYENNYYPSNDLNYHDTLIKYEAKELYLRKYANVIDTINGILKMKNRYYSVQITNSNEFIDAIKFFDRIYPIENKVLHDLNIQKQVENKIRSLLVNKDTVDNYINITTMARSKDSPLRELFISDTLGFMKFTNIINYKLKKTNAQINSAGSPNLIELKLMKDNRLENEYSYKGYFILTYTELNKIIGVIEMGMINSVPFIMKLEILFPK